MKKLLALLIIIIVAITTVGCVEIKVSRTMRSDASVVDRVEIILDTEEISKYSNIVDTTSKIESLLTANGYTIVDSPVNTIVGEIVYPTLEDFRAIYGSNDEGLEEGFFFDKYETIQLNPFAYYVTSGKVNEVWQQNFNEYPIELLDEIVYTYSYASTYKSITSDGLVREDNGYYIHEWTFDSSDVEYATMFISQSVPNSTSWYFLAIVVALLLVATGFAIVEYRKKRKVTEEDGYGR